jgi:hypothetical protein
MAGGAFGEQRKVNSNTFLRAVVTIDVTAQVLDARALMKGTVMGGTATIQPVTDIGGATAVGSPIIIADGESWDVNWPFISVTGSGSFALV